jgi:hypothetical protein
MPRFVTLTLVLVLVPGLASAQDPEALRRELNEVRRQLDAMKTQYETTIQALTERLRRLERGATDALRPPATAPAPAPPASAGGAQPPAVAPGAATVVPPATPRSAPLVAQTSPGSPPSPADLLRPREPFSLIERRGPGQLLFDIGIVGDLVANFTQDNIDTADAGTFFGRENRLFPREIEVNLYGRIDPYAQGLVRFEFAEEFEDGERVTEAKLAEAYLSLVSLPYGFRFSAGQLPVRFGQLSHLHREALPQVDAPNVLVRFLGEEQFRETGAELAWVAPLPFYLEALAGAYNGDNEVAFGRGSLKQPLVSGRLRTFVELGDQVGLQLGASAATGQTPERRRQTLLGYDAKTKWTPEGWRHALLTLGSEGIWSRRRVERSGDVTTLVDTDGDEIPDTEETATTTDKRTRERFGWYVYGEVQPWRRWSGGIRFDSTQLLETPGREWAIQPYVTFMPSDFLRFRLGWKHTERDRREPFSANDAAARRADEILLQGTFYLGAHAPHPF